MLTNQFFYKLISLSHSSSNPADLLQLPCISRSLWSHYPVTHTHTLNTFWIILYCNTITLFNAVSIPAQLFVAGECIHLPQQRPCHGKRKRFCEACEIMIRKLHWSNLQNIIGADNKPAATRKGAIEHNNRSRFGAVRKMAGNADSGNALRAEAETKAIHHAVWCDEGREERKKKNDCAPTIERSKKKHHIIRISRYKRFRGNRALQIRLTASNVTWRLYACMCVA